MTPEEKYAQLEYIFAKFLNEMFKDFTKKETVKLVLDVLLIWISKCMYLLEND